MEGGKFSSLAENAAQMRRWTTFSDIYIPDDRKYRNQSTGSSYVTSYKFRLLTYGGAFSVSTTKLFISSSSLFSSGCDTSSLQPRFFSRFETKKEMEISLINISKFSYHFLWEMIKSNSLNSEIHGREGVQISDLKGALSLEFCCFQLHSSLKSLPGTFTCSQNVQMD